MGHSDVLRPQPDHRRDQGRAALSMAGVRLLALRGAVRHALSGSLRPHALASGQRNGAEDGTRTRDPHLGKVMLYQLSHFRSELRAPVLLVPRARVDLATPRFSVACSTN